MRLGEAINIIWQEINFNKGQFTVSGGEVGTTNHEIRIIPLFPKLKKFLEALKKDQQTQAHEKIIKIKSAKKSLIAACKNQNLPQLYPSLYAPSLCKQCD